MTATSLDEPNPSSKVTRWELFAVVGLTVFAGWIRGSRLFEIGLSHHDEAVYAITSMVPTRTFGELAEVLVSQGYYSPPAFPMLARFANFLLGVPSPNGVLLVNWFFSLAMIPLLWWIGRSMWNRDVGLTAGLLVAFDRVEIVFARTGLTDPTFAFFLVLSLWLCRQSIESRGCWNWLAAGLACGFTWNIKYNGFLPLILATGFLRTEHLWTGRDHRRGWARIHGVLGSSGFYRLVLAAVVAVVCYLPWALLFHVKHPGGYGGLIEHHRGYFLGLGSVLSGWQLALNNYWLTQSIWFGLIAGVACLVPCRVVSLLLASATFLFLGTCWTPLFVLAASVYGLLTTNDFSTRRGGLWTVAWMAVLPALYTPYFRLWLPTQALAVLGLAVGLSSLSRSLSERHWSFSALLVLVGAAVFAYSPRLSSCSVQPAPTEGYRTAAIQLKADLAPMGPRRMFTLVRPPMRLHFDLLEVNIVPLAGDTFPADLRPGDLFLVDRALEDAGGEFRKTFESMHQRGKLQLLREFTIDPSVPTLLDDNPGIQDLSQLRPVMRLFEVVR